MKKLQLMDMTLRQTDRRELTFKEIAHIMKSPESTVKSRYKKAIAILQEKAGE